MSSRSVTAYYLLRLRRLAAQPREIAGFVTASVLHAAGHAAVAIVAAGVAICLAERFGVSALRFGPSGSGGAGNAATAGGTAFGGAAEDRALALAFFGLGVVLVKGAAGAYATFVQARLAGEVGAALRLELLDAMLAIHRLRRPRHGDHAPTSVAQVAPSVLSLTDRVRDVEAGLEQGVLGGARAIAQIVPIAVVLVALSPRMAMTAGLAMGAFGWLLGRARAGYRRATQRATLDRERLLAATDEAVRHADLWITYGAEAKARAATKSLGAAVARGTASLQARAVVLSSANEVLGAAALVAAIAASRAGWLGGATDGATLLSFAVAFFLSYRPLRELADARLAVARAEGAFDDLQRATGAATSVADDPVDVEEASASPRLWPLAALELRGLRLARGTSEPVTARIEPGAIAVVWGRTGAGKTTLLRTLLGLEAAVGGEVRFGAFALDGAPAGPRDRPFAWVPQEAPLLADTLQANVTLGADDADAAGILGSIGAGRLARTLEGAALGAGGRAVSGGARQWIALARAIATRQPVLLLDEPTSGLDAAAQRRVLEAIERLRGRRTVIVVTHRPEPLAIADVVLRMRGDDGVEQAA
jgi:ABC-type multidrug transport system fused ATPase/permease subunit